MDDKALDENVEHIAVYARVSPENKIRIVKAWQKKGQVVSMTRRRRQRRPRPEGRRHRLRHGHHRHGRGQGRRGHDPNRRQLATIVDAVREGRGIYANIKKVVGFLLGTNIGEVLTVFFAMILWHKTPLLSMQLLWINLVTDSLPAISLGMEAVESDVMEHRPKPKDEGIFAHGLGGAGGAAGLHVRPADPHRPLCWASGTAAAWRPGRPWRFWCCPSPRSSRLSTCAASTPYSKSGPSPTTSSTGRHWPPCCWCAWCCSPRWGVAFQLVLLPGWLYAAALGLILTPLVVMEIAKAIGLVRHRH